MGPILNLFRRLDFFGNQPNKLRYGDPAEANYSENAFGGLITVSSFLIAITYFYVAITAMVNGNKNIFMEADLGGDNFADQILGGNLQLLKRPVSWNDLQIKPMLNLADAEMFVNERTAWLNTSIEY
jgi:hypothetical protein